VLVRVSKVPVIAFVEHVRVVHEVLPYWDFNVLYYCGTNNHESSRVGERGGKENLKKQRK